MCTSLDYPTNVVVLRLLLYQLCSLSKREFNIVHVKFILIYLENTAEANVASNYNFGETVCFYLLFLLESYRCEKSSLV